MSLQTDGGGIWITNLPGRNDPEGYAEVTNNYLENIRAPGFIRRTSGAQPVSAGLYIDGGYRTSVRGNYINSAPIGIYWLCPHEGFNILTNYLSQTTTHEQEFDCPVEGDTEVGHVPRFHPVVPLTDTTLNNQHSYSSSQELIRQNAGVRSAISALGASRGW